MKSGSSTFFIRVPAGECKKTNNPASAVKNRLFQVLFPSGRPSICRKNMRTEKIGSIRPDEMRLSLENHDRGPVCSDLKPCWTSRIFLASSRTASVRETPLFMRFLTYSAFDRTLRTSTIGPLTSHIFFPSLSC
jgi:hypothetical protein